VLTTYYYKGAGEHQGAWRFEFWPLIHIERPRAQDLQWNFRRRGLQRLTASSVRTAMQPLQAGGGYFSRLATTMTSLGWPTSSSR